MRLSRCLFRLTSSTPDVKAPQPKPDFPTFTDMLDHIVKHKQLKENTLSDFIELTSLLNASLIPNTRNDLGVKALSNYPLISDVKFTSDNLIKLQKILLDNSNRLGFYHTELPLKTLAQYLQAIDELYKLEISSQAKSLLRSRLSSLMSFERIFLAQLSADPADINVHNVNYLLVLSIQYEQWHILNLLLHLLLKKEGVFKIETFRSLTTILNSVHIKHMYEIESQNFKYFIKTFYYRTLFKRIIPVIDSETSGIPKIDKIVLLTSILMVFRHSQTTSKGQIQILLSKLGSCLKSDMTPSEKRRLLLSYLKILADIGQNKLKLAQLPFCPKVFAQHAAFVTPWENLKMAHALMNLEVSAYFDLAPWKQSSVRPEFWRLENFSRDDFSSIVVDNTYLSFFGNVNDKVVKSLNLPFVRTLLHLGIFLKNFKKLEHPLFEGLPQLERRLEVGFSGINSSTFQTGTMILHLQRLLLERPGVTVERETRIGGLSTDYLVSYGEGGTKKFILEVDGPIHYVSQGDVNSKTKLRNFLLLSKDYKLVTLPLDYFSTIVAMQKEHELINAIFDEIETTQLLLICWPPHGRFNSEDSETENSSNFNLDNDLSMNFDVGGESSKHLWD